MFDELQQNSNRTSFFDWDEAFQSDQHQSHLLHQEGRATDFLSSDVSRVVDNFNESLPLNQHSYMHASSHRRKPENPDMKEGGNLKVFKCPLCTYTCDRRWNLKSHMKVHTGEKPFSCPFCDHRTSHKSNLHYHINAKHADQSHHIV